MALGIMNWNLPASGPSDEYTQRAQTAWIPTVLRQAGVTEFRAYRNPHDHHLHVMVETEFDSLDHLNAWVNSDEYAQLKNELAEYGATDISDQTWDASPVVPLPIRPT